MVVAEVSPKKKIILYNRLPLKCSGQPTTDLQQKFQQRDQPGTPTIQNMKNDLIIKN